MLISTRGRYGLRVLVDMAEHQTDGYLPLKQISARQGISEKYLESIVKTLVADGILVGLRGKGGGYRLNRAPDRIGVGDVIRLLEGSLAPVTCLERESGGEACPRMAECRTLELWRGLDHVIDEYLGRFTIRDLMRRDDDSYDYVI